MEVKIYNCCVCNKQIKLKPYHVKRYKGPFTCSRTCRGSLLKKIYTGTNNPNFKYNDKLEKFLSDRQKAIKLRAKNKNLDFNIPVNYLLNLYNKQNGLCYYTGIPLKITTDNWLKKGQADVDVLSVDRIDPSKGYVEDNLVLCCSSINKLKGNSTLEELNYLLTAISLKNFNVCEVKFKKVRENAVAPFKANLGDAGFDLTACHVEKFDDKIKVFTGISIQAPMGWAMALYPRSSITKKGVMLGNSVGLIDNGYTGEIIAVFNKINNTADIQVGDRVVQLVPLKMPFVNFVEVEELSETNRGSQGFGSSGA